MDADQAGNRQQCLAGNSPPQRAQERFASKLHAPAIQAKPDVTVEPASSRRVGGKVGQAMTDIRPGQVDTVVPQKHAVSVCLITGALVVRTLCRAHFHTPAEPRKCRTELARHGCRTGGVESDRHEVHVRAAQPRHARGNGSVDVQGVLTVQRLRNRLRDDRLEGTRNPASSRPGGDHSIHAHAFERVVPTVRVVTDIRSSGRWSLGHGCVNAGRAMLTCGPPFVDVRDRMPDQPQHKDDEHPT